MLFCGYHVMSYGHKPKDIAETLKAYDGAMVELKDALASDGTREIKKRLRGEMLQPVFRKP